MRRGLAYLSNCGRRAVAGAGSGSGSVAALVSSRWRRRGARSALQKVLAVDGGRVDLARKA